MPQGLGLGFGHPGTTEPTLSPLFGTTRYPSLPREGATSRQSRSDSGQTSLTPVTALTSPIGADNDSEAATPLALGSRNPFLASIIAAAQTPSTGRGPTSSGTPSKKLTSAFSDRSASRPGSLGGQMSTPGPTDTTQTQGRTWPTTCHAPRGTVPLRKTKQRRARGQGLRQPQLGAIPHPIQANDVLTYGNEPRRRRASSEDSSKSSPSNSTNDSGERITRTDFQYDWESIYPGFYPEEVAWGEPRTDGRLSPEPVKPWVLLRAHNEPPHSRRRTRRSRHGRRRKCVGQSGPATTGTAGTACPCHKTERIS